MTNIVNVDNYLNIFYNWSDFLINFWNILNTNLGELVWEYVGIGFKVPAALVLALTPLYYVTLLEFMLGTGLAIYIGYQLITWFLNLIT